MNRLNAAEDASTPAKILEKLAEDSSIFVRFRVAGNPNAPVKTLKKFAEGSHYGIKQAVAGNPSITEEIIIILLDSGRGKEDLVRELYRNKSISKVQKDMIFILTGVD